jgi:soluble lytic murein transglycosylase-like protein
MQAVLAGSTFLVLAAAPAHACWDDAAHRYAVSSALLYAIARVESGLNPTAVGWNRNGTRDIGLMQINSTWLPTLARYGVTERDLLEPCMSIHIGAWILAGNFAGLGYTWEAVGAYNAAHPSLRRAYVHKVRRHLPAQSDTPSPSFHYASATAQR